jgi:zinc finger-like protein
MPGPINALRFVHSAILHEANSVEERAHGELSADEAKQLGEDLSVFDELMRGHTHGEEVGLFPKLAEIESHFAQAYLRDHEVEHKLFDELKEAVGKVAGGDAGAKTTVRRHATAIRHHVATHIGKENELILPFVDEKFPPPEQGAMLGKILSVFTPQDMEKMLPWIVSRLDDETAAKYLGVLGNAQPPEVFAKSIAWIKAGIPAEQTARLAEKVDALK